MTIGQLGSPVCLHQSEHTLVSIYLALYPPLLQLFPKTISLVHTMLLIMLVVLRMVTQEQLATFVHASKDFAS